MKQIITLFILSFLVCCKHEEEKSHIMVSTLLDVTDTRLLYPDPTSYQALFGLGNDGSPEATFRISRMSDRETNEDIELWLPSEKDGEEHNENGDIHFRKRNIVAFYRRVLDTTEYFLKTLTKGDTSLRYSECFKAIGSELARMKQAGPTNATLLVYSDLQENSTLFNCYSGSGQAELRGKIDAVVKRFDNAQLLPATLHNFQIFFVYRPLSREDDTRFTAMVKVYRKLLEKRGGTVHVQAQNKRFTP